MAPGRPARRPATVQLGQTILRALRRNQAALSDGPLILAVSGGADSLAMLLAASAVRQSLGRDIVVAHLSHGVRKSAERREAALVRRVARYLHVPLEHEQAAAGSSEASARATRYAFFARVAHAHSATAVATAHTRDDQTETLLLRLTRGSGLRGAGAIRELSQSGGDDAPMTMLRPILQATRGDTTAVCAEWELTPASDGTNRSVHYARNRVRRRVLPELRKINPNAVAALAAFAAGAQEDDDLLASLAGEAIAGVEERNPTETRWPADALRSIPVPLLVRVLQAAWLALRGGGAALSREQIESIQRVLDRGSGSVDLAATGTFAVQQTTATLTTQASPTVSLPPTPLAISGSTTVGRWLITARVDSGLAVGDDPWCATLDLDALGDNVCVRGRIAGDRIQSLGLDHEVRLQDLLVNAKIPRSTRDDVPLVVAGGKIAWVAGVRIAEWAKVTDKTTRVVQIEARPIS